MRVRRNPGIAIAVALTAGLAGFSAFGQSIDVLKERSAEADSLLSELSQPDLETWESVETKILRLWSQSGSDTVDYLLVRGQEALEAEDFDTAIEHLTAATDHAPDFAEAWNARATAFFLIEEYSLALLDIERALALNPNHFGALSGAGIIYEQLGDFDLALKALRIAFALNPHRDNISDAIKRLEQRTGSSTL